jgi:hypothetical protein
MTGGRPSTVAVETRERDLGSQWLAASARCCDAIAQL